MKVLFIHADFIEYTATEKAVETAEALTTKKDSMKEVLVAFISVEKDDECADNAIEEIANVASTLKVDNIMLYPYAHLSSNLATPKKAIAILADIQTNLSEKFNVKKSPFGWYKSFKISCKGHPLSELSRHISCTSEKKEKKIGIKSKWYILTPEGTLTEAEKFDFSSYPELKKFYEYESSGSRKAEREPAHIKLMRSHSLVDYEPGSDYGNMRWYPKGYLIKRLLEEKVEDMCLSIGAMEVETPLMYDLDHTALRKYVEKFPARQYKVIADKGKDMFLRFAACFGQYLIAHDTTISYRNLPLRFFELAKSFRKEQHGELSGIKRLRSFTMPDMHTICADENQALTEFKQQFNLAKEWANIIEIDGEIAMRFVCDFYAKNKAFASELVKTWGKPALIEMWDSRYFYFVMKFEININDSVGKTFALSTVQIDVENTEAFDIEYIDQNNQKQNPYLLHTSVSGGVDRCVAAILETEEIKMRKGTKGSFPFWLSPTQVRLIPVNDDFTRNCITLEETIKGRVDIDDRDISIAKKIREAEKEWIPIIIVIGEDEQHGIFKPRYRFQNNIEQLTLDELNTLITSKMKNKPFRPTPLPKLLSKRPTFK